MKRNIPSLITRLYIDQSGQMLPVMTFIVIGLLAVVALSLSVGLVYSEYRELQAATNASALAGAQQLPNATATAAATSFSSVAGSNNSFGNLKNVTMVAGWPKLECLTTLSNAGMACAAPANANAIQVKQQVTVPILFAGLFGGSVNTTLTATATASMRGASVAPYNVAVIVDATQSMNDTDSDSQCSTTRIACALQGIRVLIQALAPCSAALTNCGTVTSGAYGSGNVANSVDRVSLFSFPNMTTTSAPDDYGCSGTKPTKEPYTFPPAGASSYTPLGSPAATYEFVGFSSDYKVSDTAASLNTASNFSKAVGGGVSTCDPMSAPGGEGTYYAGAIYAAQSALVAEQSANPGSQNVIILISDGNAGTTDSGAMGSAGSSGSYPSTKNQCAQAVTAAQNAATANVYGNGAVPTKIYAVAYGAEASGCGTDNPAITPCQTMQKIASAPQNFYSDYTATGGTSSCISASQPTTNLNQIFLDIAGDLTVARLIPNGTT
ncbi:MAG: TadG family pilus assembly protein [Acidobacteriaceae bacterium]